MRRLLILLGGILWTLSAAGQEPQFPQKGPIELTVLFPAGSSADITARLLAAGMSKNLPGNVIVVPRPGAGGAAGYKHVASQKPDGYSPVWNSNSISTTYYSGLLPFDYEAFHPIARVLVESPVLAVRSDSAWKTLIEFLADARARPGKITVGNSGFGSHTHISSVALFKAGAWKSMYPTAALRSCRASSVVTSMRSSSFLGHSPPTSSRERSGSSPR